MELSPVFEWKPGPLPFRNAKRADAQAIGEELARIGVEDDGDVSTKKALQAAKSRTSALHPHITWNKDAAARKHQLAEMRHIIGSIRLRRVELPNEPLPPAYISIAAGDGRKYRPAAKVEADMELQAALLREGLAALRAWRLRFSRLRVLCDRLDDLLAEFDTPSPKLDAAE